MLLIEEIRLLPIVLKLKLSFDKTGHNMQVVEAVRMDEKRVRFVIEMDLPEKVLH